MQRGIDAGLVTVDKSGWGFSFVDEVVFGRVAADFFAMLMMRI